MPSVHVQLCELAWVGSYALFLTRAQHKRITLADSTISPGTWHLVAISYRDMFTNKHLSLYFLQKAGISLTYEHRGLIRQYIWQDIT